MNWSLSQGKTPLASNVTRIDLTLSQIANKRLIFALLHIGQIERSICTYSVASISSELSPPVIHGPGPIPFLRLSNELRYPLPIKGEGDQRNDMSRYRPPK